MAKWSSHVDCDGVEHDVRHFHDSRHAYQLPPTVMRPRLQNVDVRVTFSMHCFTRDPREGEVVRPCQIYHKNKEGRLFCATRTELGRGLSNIIATILERNCFLTDRKNHVLFSSGRTENGDEYAVFFTLARASSNLDWDVNMTVLSAHPRQGFRPRGKPLKFRDLLRRLV
jgi:hypothetical protein